MGSGSREADVWGGYGEEFRHLFLEREEKENTKQSEKRREARRQGGRGNPKVGGGDVAASKASISGKV